MMKDLKSALNKLAMDKDRKMLAGNQILPSERKALITLTVMLITPLLATGLTLLLSL